MRRLLVLLTMGILLIATIVGAQSSLPIQKPGEQTLAIDVNLVNVLFSVTDKKGRFIRDQKKNQFRVFEEGKPQVITNFSAETDLPLTVALLIDASGSAQSRLQFEEDAAIQFLSSTLIPGKDRGLVVDFATSVKLIQDYTDDPALLAKSIKTIRIGGATVLQDAVYWTVTQKLANQKGRRAIIIVSDGDDNASRIQLSDVLESAQRNDVVVFAISTNSIRHGGENNSRGDPILRSIAELTGGKVFFPTKLADVSSGFHGITQELRSQYTLAYLPTNPKRDGSFRKIRIEHVDRRYVVRSRNGYYAPRP